MKRSGGLVEWFIFPYILGAITMKPATICIIAKMCFKAKCLNTDNEEK